MSLAKSRGSVNSEALRRLFSLFRVGRLQKLFYLPNELVRAMSSDFSEIQTDSGKVYRVFRQILPSDCT